MTTYLAPFPLLPTPPPTPSTPHSPSRHAPVPLTHMPLPLPHALMAAPLSAHPPPAAHRMQRGKAALPLLPILDKRGCRHGLLAHPQHHVTAHIVDRDLGTCSTGHVAWGQGSGSGSRV